MKRGLFAILLLLISAFPSASIQAAPKPSTMPLNPLSAGFTSNPDQDSGWVRANVVGGGCNDSGSCSGNIRPGAATLYEYTPDREQLNTDPNLTQNLSLHGGDPTVVDREICRIGNQQVAWSGGSWHHGATWIKGRNGVWEGPINPHWVFAHEDECYIEPTPTPTPAPTMTPMPATITVVVYACGQPFATRITNETTGEFHDAVSRWDFKVQVGQGYWFVAAGYGDYVDTRDIASPPAVVRIDMDRVGGTACPAPTPPPPPTSGPTPTAIPQTCSGAEWAPRLQALNLAPPIGTREDPIEVPAGPLALTWSGDPRGDDTALVAITVFDITAGTQQSILTSVWERPFEGGDALSNLFVKKRQVGVDGLQTDRSNAWTLYSGWLRFNTPALEVGHTYEIFTHYAAHSSYCAYFSTSAFVTVGSPFIDITVRRGLMNGIDSGPIAGRPLTVDGVVEGQTTAEGTQRYRVAAGSANNPSSVGVVTPDNEFTWKVEGSCLERTGVRVNLDTHTVSGITAGGCNLTWTQIVIPVVSGRAFFRNALSGDYQSFEQGRLTLVTSNGTTISNHLIQGGGVNTLPLNAPILRPLVGPDSQAWSLSYTAPTAIWDQTPPRAGSAGDSVAGDLSVTFAALDSLDNRFFLERDGANPVHLLTLRGSVRLITRDGEVQSGPYGTLTAKWTHYSERSTSVAADGSWVIQIPDLGYTPTITLTFQKNLATAAYDLAEPGTVAGESMGVAATANQITNIVISNDGTGEGYNFVLRELAPPPPPPVASGELRIWIHSHLDPEQGVYKSETQTISWPHAEILDVSPVVDFTPLPEPPIGYRYEQRVVAWAYDGSIGYAARDLDAFKRDGCRQGAKPKDAGDLSFLTGCVYAYQENPTAAQMNEQARVWWSMVLPPAMVEGVYSYQLPRFESVNVQLSVLVETATIDTTTGQRWSQRQVMPGTFKVKLVAPRTLK